MRYKNDKKYQIFIITRFVFPSLKCTKIRFRPGLCPGPRWGSLRRSPRPPGWLGRGIPLPHSPPYGASVLRPPSTQNPGYASAGNRIIIRHITILFLLTNATLGVVQDRSADSYTAFFVCLCVWYRHSFFRSCLFFSPVFPRRFRSIRPARCRNVRLWRACSANYTVVEQSPECSAGT